jgi:hypothetical protein
MGRHGLDFSGLGMWQLAGACEGSNEPVCYVNCGELLDQLRNCYPVAG